MRKILIVNTREKECAIWQYGVNFFQSLRASTNYAPLYLEPAHEVPLREFVQYNDVEAVIYNWHPTQKGWLAGAPFDVGKGVRNITIFHEIEFPTHQYDAVLYSKPCFIERERWHHIPLVIPGWDRWQGEQPLMDFEWCPIIGVSGYGGAHADKMIGRVLDEFKRAAIRLHLPPSFYGDVDGKTARSMAERCQKMVENHGEILLTVCHHWMDQPDLMRWLGQNNLNCYIRDTSTPWTGVSAAMCSALAAQRPMAINRSQCFRHLWDVQPSICVEDRSLKEILHTGIEPLLPIYEANSRERLVGKVEKVLKEVGL